MLSEPAERRCGSCHAAFLRHLPANGPRKEPERVIQIKPHAIGAMFGTNFEVRELDCGVEAEVQLFLKCWCKLIGLHSHQVGLLSRWIQATLVTTPAYQHQRASRAGLQFFPAKGLAREA